MELYNPTTDVMNFAAMEKDIMIAADVEVADLDTTELKRKMTCKSVAKGWKKWVKAVKKHPKYRKATKAQRAKFWKKAPSGPSSSTRSTDAAGLRPGRHTARSP